MNSAVPIFLYLLVIKTKEINSNYKIHFIKSVILIFDLIWFCKGIGNIYTFSCAKTTI